MVYETPDHISDPCVKIGEIRNELQT